MLPFHFYLYLFTGLLWNYTYVRLSLLQTSYWSYAASTCSVTLTVAITNRVPWHTNTQVALSNDKNPVMNM